MDGCWRLRRHLGWALSLSFALFAVEPNRAWFESMKRLTGSPIGAFNNQSLGGAPFFYSAAFGGYTSVLHVERFLP